MFTTLENRDRETGAGLFPALARWAPTLACVVLCGVPTVEAAELAEERLLIQGSRLTLYADADTTDADQILNLGERGRVRTCFGGPEVPCGSIEAGDPRVAGLVVRAELRGPELPRAVALETVPGGAFLLPGLQQEGDYFLENIRLVDAATEAVLGRSEPSVAVLHVREIVVTSATVRALSLEELAERGIQLGAGNFQAYDFAVGFAIGAEFVEIEFPVIYTGDGEVLPAAKPRVNLANLPTETVAVVQRWKPPRIQPVKFEFADPVAQLTLGTEGEETLVLPMFGAIVIPGTVTFLNQFFDATLVVANAAPGTSDVTLRNVRGAAEVPSGNVLRLAATEPPVSPGQLVPVAKADGGRTLLPGEQGFASWTVEGLRAGTHTLSMNVTGEIHRPGREPLSILTRTQAAVEVVDARFNTTFGHPDTVREGEEYTLFVTISNMSPVTQNLVTVDLDEQHMTGARPADPTDPLERTVETLAPGASETVEFELVSELTGKVRATTFQSTSENLRGTVRLRTGVGELGIPLSPATLIMPRFSEYLTPPHLPEDELLKSHVRLLGLAYSLAVAPSALVPPELPFVRQADVERRAIDLAEAGQRRFLQDGLLESTAVLALDQLGNRHHLSGFDELRRKTAKGLRAAEQLAGVWRRLQDERSLDAEELFDRMTETVSYARPWLAAGLVEGAAEGLELEIERAGSGLRMRHPADDEERAVRTLPYGEIYSLSEDPAGSAAALLALVGHLESDETFAIRVHNPTASELAGRLIVVVPDDQRTYRRVELGAWTLAAGTSAELEASVSGEIGTWRDLGTGAVLTAVRDAGVVPLPPFRVVGGRQDYRMAEEGPDRLGNWMRPARYGNGLSYLLNRPPAVETAERADAWGIVSRFDGLDVNDETVHRVVEHRGTGAWVQPNSERVVNVRYDGGISSAIFADEAVLDHEHAIELGTIEDEWGNALVGPTPAPILERVPQHDGALVSGRVIRGTGEGAEGVQLELVRLRKFQTLDGYEIKRDLAATATTGPDGTYTFDYVETPHWENVILDRFGLKATIPAGDDPELEPAVEEEIGTVIRRQNVLSYRDIALLGRGTMTGRLTYLDDGSPVAGGRVRASSTLFQDQRLATTEVDGSFRIPGVVVGPITLTGEDGDGRLVFATVALPGPGETLDVELQIPRGRPPVGRGTVTGRVWLLGADGERTPVSGARVQVSNGAEGGSYGSQETVESGWFRFENVPEGLIQVQAAHWDLSRSATIGGGELVAGETVEIDLVLTIGGERRVEGLVLYDDPFTGLREPVSGASVFLQGTGLLAITDADGRYVFEGVPVQGVDEVSGYTVLGVDFERRLQNQVRTPKILDVSPDVVSAPAIVLSPAVRGAVTGVVLDPLGRPAGGVPVVLVPYEEKITNPDGSFVFENVPQGRATVVPHVGDGLEPNRVGWFGQKRTEILFPGHRPFVSVQMVGSGHLNVYTGTATGDSQTLIYYRPTYYSSAEKAPVMRGQYIRDETNPNGRLSLELPVGEFELVAYNPFHGVREISGEIEYIGQVVDLDIIFEDAAVVYGTVVDVDGVTPVPDVEVKLATRHLLPQSQYTDAQGRFEYHLVPKGNVSVTAAGFVGVLERVGRADGIVTQAGQELELVVQMKEQGSVVGRVLENFNGDVRPISYAQFYVQELTYPFRRIPSEASTYLSTDADGRYELSHVYAGGVEVVARDPNQVSRQGKARTEITTDWQVAEVPDIVMTTSIGSVSVLVRDPESGGPVANCRVSLSTHEQLTTDGDGRVRFEALPLATYSVYAFHAPTGRAGRLSNVRLSTPGENVAATVYLDLRGEISGVLYDTATLADPVAGATVQLSGRTAAGSLRALSTTSGIPATLGEFEFLGIPEGTFTLTAVAPSSPRRAGATVSLTETSPIARINMVLEPIDDLYFQFFESLRAGRSPVDVGAGIFSLTVAQPGYAFTRTTPEPGTQLYRYPDILVDREVSTLGEEIGGEERERSYSFTPGSEAGRIDGTGTTNDPYQVVLKPKGTVRVRVVSPNGVEPIPYANVTLHSSGDGYFPSAAGADGTVLFHAVPAGNLTASAADVITGQGGTAHGSLVYDDDVADLLIRVEPAVSAWGVIYRPTPDDRPIPPSEWVPMEGAIVVLRDSDGIERVAFSAADGSYQFDGLPLGGYQLSAQDQNGDQFAATSGSLLVTDGVVIRLPDLILDAGPPRILSIMPPPGIENVPRTASVEIVFSERLHAAHLPSGPTSSYFDLRGPGNQRANGSWSASLDGMGRQVVRFVPSEPYENLRLYSLKIVGAIQDLVGRRLSSSNVGSNFRTSDSLGPEVIGTQPPLDLPVDPARPIRIDFNEALVAGAEALDGDGVDDAGELWALGEAGDWIPLPVALTLTRSGYSLQLEPIPGIEVEDDTLRRRIVVDRLVDGVGNPMPRWEREFRIWDENPPELVAVPPPANSDGGSLVHGVAYTIVPVLDGLDDQTPENPGGDLARVEYFFQDPTDPVNPQQADYAATSHPFSYSFIGAYSGDGVAPRPFPLWVRAVDTSTNESEVVEVPMQVLPNAPPEVGEVELEAVGPVPGTFYAGTDLTATISGLSDVDGAQLTLFVELWQEGASIPIDAEMGLGVPRPAGGWEALVPPVVPFRVPLDQVEASTLFVRVRALDSQGALAQSESARFLVVDDATDARVDGVAAVDRDGVSRLAFFIGDELHLELRAWDEETDVREVTVTWDREDVLGPSLTAIRTGDADRWATPAVVVPPDAFTEATPIAATIEVLDWGGNTTTRSFSFDVAPEPDPTAPVVRWQTPWGGAPWPSDYEAVLSSQGGAELLLRAEVTDVTLDEDGNEVPGDIVRVQFRGPVRSATGELELAPDWSLADSVPGSAVAGGGVWQLLWTVPDEIEAGTAIPYAVRAVDSGGSATIAQVAMVAEPALRVFEGVQTTVGDLTTGPGDRGGLVYLLDGSLLSFRQLSLDDTQSVGGLVLYAGGDVENGALSVRETVLTAPEITSYQSAVTHHPIALDVERLVAVGAASEVRLTGRGLLGSTRDQSLLAPGLVAPGDGGGGSHGGRGTGPAPGPVHGRLAWPDLPGVGGGSTSGSETNAGGAGGGVLWLRGPSATLRVEGAIRADGASVAGGTRGGGAGGSIALDFALLEGPGEITARGGHGSRRTSAGGGGGGRIWLALDDLASDVDLGAQVSVAGGFDLVSNPASRGGAGTLVVERRLPDGTSSRVLTVADPSGDGVARGTTRLPSAGFGSVVDVDLATGDVRLTADAAAETAGSVVGDRLRIDGPATTLGTWTVTAQRPVAGGTVVHLDAEAAELADLRARLDAGDDLLFQGLGRLDSLAVSGPALVVAGDPIELGPVGATVFDSRDHVELTGGARLLFSGEGPVSVLDATPPPGTAVLLGSSVDVTWTVSDPVGLRSVRTVWLGGDPVEITPSGEPLELSNEDPTILLVPHGWSGDTATLRVEGTDVGDRTRGADFTWSVAPNEAPTAAATAGEARAGRALVVSVDAADREGLAAVRLVATGPVTPAQLSVPLEGTAAVAEPSVLVDPEAVEGELVTLRVEVEDAFGAVVALEAIELSVVPNDLPVGTVAVAPGAPSALKPGLRTTLRVHAEDLDGLVAVELRAVGDVEPDDAVQTVAVSGTSVDVDFEVAAPVDAAEGEVLVTALLTDSLGASAETDVFALPLRLNAPPEGQVSFAAGTPAQVPAGSTVTVEVHAEDEEGLAEVIVEVTGPATPVVTSFPVAGPTADVQVDITVAESAQPSDVVEVRARLRDAWGNPDVVTEPAVLAIEADGTIPTVEVAGVESGYAAGQTLEATITSADDVGVAALEITFDGSTVEVGEPVSPYQYAVEVDRTIATPRDTTFVVVAVDHQGNRSEPATVPVVLRPDAEPTVSLAVAGGTTLLAGSLLEARADAADDLSVETVRFVLEGAVADSDERHVGQTSATEIYRFQLPTDLPDGSSATLRAEAVDSYGHVASTSEVLTFVADEIVPVVTVTLDPARPDDRYFPGEAVDITVDATDEAGVELVRIEIDGTVLSGSPPLDYRWTVPAPSEITTVDLVATAFDPVGNEGVEVRSLTVDPTPNGGIPTVEIDCPTAGATLPSGFVATISVAATDDEGVAAVELFRDDEVAPFATVTPPAGVETPFVAQASLPLPVVEAGEETVRVRAVVRDAATNSAETETVIHVVPTLDLEPDGSGTANDWTALEGGIAVLRSGTLTLEESRGLGGLIVLDGATVTHPAGGTSAVQLDVAGPVYVACGGAIDASRRGYAGGQTHAGESASEYGSGGSHLGRGGRYGGNRSGSTFGSVYRPAEAGAGGEHASSGQPGGGVIRLTGERVVVDGAIVADGGTHTSSSRRGGAGGSVDLAAVTLSGSGTLTARGGDATSGLGSGGGGAVTVRWSESSDLARLEVAASGGRAGQAGGPGTVLLRGPEDRAGELVVDSGTGLEGTGEPIQLPALGAGVAGAGSGGAVLDPGFDPASSFVGHWVEISDVDGNPEGVFEIAEIAGQDIVLAAGESGNPSVDPGDRWQGVYLFDRLALRGELVRLESEDPIRVLGATSVETEVETSALATGSLRLRTGGTLRHPPAVGSDGALLVLEVETDLVIDPGAAIDVTGGGYAGNVTYPGLQLAGSFSGGSHMGVGGVYSGPAGETYGSVTRPRENGAGGRSGNSLRGGGSVTVEAGTIVVNGAIRAQGESTTRNSWRAGAGGSIWLRSSGPVSGDGEISVRGGRPGNSDTSGGGGALSIEHGGLHGAVADRLLAEGGAQEREGGAGTVYLHGPSSTYGDLVVDSGTVVGEATVLPALGGGLASPGTSGALLETGRGFVQPFFEGHWIEVRSASGALRGTWRIAGIEGGALTLEPNGSEDVDVQEGDAWQGIYRFDNYTLAGTVEVQSADPIRVSGTQEIRGVVEAEVVRAHDLVLLEGAVLRHPSATSSASRSLTIELTGDLVVETGAAIDVTGRGYPGDATHPDAQLAGNYSGGSHLGFGGVYTGPPGQTYGSVTRPAENGAGGRNGGLPGGGSVRIVAREVVVDGDIRAEGQSTTSNSRQAGAGGSVWIRTSGTVSGEGEISVRGGRPGSNYTSGGGGAIAIHHGGELSGTVATRLAAMGGAADREGGAGTVYLHGPGSTYGNLIVDNGSVVGEATELPALGSGVAGAGSQGAVLVTDRASIPAYFVGHWVEVSDSGGLLRDTWRVTAIDGPRLILEPNDGESVVISPGDLWQGVYRFDDYTVGGAVEVLSQDPIRVVGTQVLRGEVEAESIRAHHLLLTPGTVLRHPAGSAAAPGGLSIELTGNLTIEAGAAIDVTGRGYPADTTYPETELAGSYSGGSHLGQGGIYDVPAGETYGSVVRPLENGAGGRSGGLPGGGSVRIVARDVTVDGEIRADGQSSPLNSRQAGAGGSVWIRAAGLMSGGGLVSARGGNPGSSYTSGGGGAIAVEHGGLAGEVAHRLFAEGGVTALQGGAGTVYAFGPGSTFGDLVIDNRDVEGESTVLPSLGGGIAQSGSAGGRLKTDRPSIPAYFVGHWVRVVEAEGAVERGIWRIAAIEGGDLLLEPGAAVAVGDLWQGVYRFDSLRISGDVRFESGDPVLVEGDQVLDGEITLEHVRARDVRLADGTVLRHPATVDPAAPRSLVLELDGDLVVEAGAAIDVTGLGYRGDTTHVDAALSGPYCGGSHMGLGGVYTAPAGSSYGSVTRPRENGAGGRNGGLAGGGSIEIVARDVVVDGAVRADGASTSSNSRQAGAGGSVWIRAAGAVSGEGEISARGGRPGTNYASGGGGAIAIHHGGELSGSVATQLAALGGEADREGGAGTIFLHGPSSTYGDLVVDNGAVVGEATVLPSLGSGAASPGSSARLLLTDRASIPEYFEGHWIELSNVLGQPKGRWQVESVAAGAMTLSTGATVSPGDLWQGMYRFDDVHLLGTLAFESDDPVLVEGQQTIDGSITLERVRSHDLRLTADSTLRHPVATPAVPRSIDVRLTGDLTIEAGASIDATGLGYPGDATHPGEALPGSFSGGSHMGRGGVYSAPAGSTFGSVTRPGESGGGGRNGGLRGGGVVRIEADDVVVDGRIAADGESSSSNSRRAGAGGSVWLRAAGEISGSGSISANGGRPGNSDTSGGGGAIALEHQGLTGAVASRIHATGGAGGREGGAGTIHLLGPTSTYGDLHVDNDFIDGEATELPALGGGVAQVGSFGSTLVTDRVSIQPYFVGHWVEVRDPVDALRGTWRVEAISGSTLTLEEGASVETGDAWQGVYRFDSLEVVEGAFIESLDPIRTGSGPGLTTLDPAERSAGIEPATLPGTWRVVADPAAADAPARLELRAGRRLGPMRVSTDGLTRGLWTGGEPPRVAAFPTEGAVRVGAFLEGLPASAGAPHSSPSGAVSSLSVTLPEGERLRLVRPLAGRSLAVGDRTVRVFGPPTRRGRDLAVEVRSTNSEPVLELIEIGGHLLVARRDGVELVSLAADPTEPGEASQRSPAALGWSVVAAVGVGQDEAVLALRRDDVDPVVALTRFDAGNPPAELHPVAPDGVPAADGDFRLLRSGDRMVLVADASADLEGVVWTYVLDDLSEPRTAFVPEVGQRILAADEAGLIVATAKGLELLSPVDEAAWRASAVLPVTTEPTTAAADGGRHLVRLADGTMVVLHASGSRWDRSPQWSVALIVDGWAPEELALGAGALAAWQPGADTEPAVLDIETALETALSRGGAGEARP